MKTEFGVVYQRCIGRLEQINSKAGLANAMIVKYGMSLYT